MIGKRSSSRIVSSCAYLGEKSWAPQKNLVIELTVTAKNITSKMSAQAFGSNKLEESKTLANRSCEACQF